MRLKLKQTISENPIITRCDESLKTAYMRMKQAGIRHLPVMDDDGNLAGIISDRDFQRAMWRISLVDAHGLPDGPAFKDNALVSEYMTWPVKTLSHINDLQTAVRMMIREKISAIVVTENEEVIGIITHEDLLRVLDSLLTKPDTFKDKVMKFAYNSPLGVVTDLLSSIGI